MMSLFWQLKKSFLQFFKNIHIMAIFWHSNGNFPEGHVTWNRLWCVLISKLTVYSKSPAIRWTFLKIQMNHDQNQYYREVILGFHIKNSTLDTLKRKKLQNTNTIETDTQIWHLAVVITKLRCWLTDY